MISDFFIWCSGARSLVLKESPIDRGKYVGIGMAVFFVSLLSVVSSTFFITYALSDKLPDPVTGAIAINFDYRYGLTGLLWGIIILTIDRNIIVSVKKTGVFKEELAKAWPRIVLAFFIGIIISTPLEMKFFEKEINQKVEANIYREVNQTVAKDIDYQKQQIKDLSAQRKNIEDKQKDAFKKADDEVKGKGLSGIAKYGRKAKGWEKKSETYQKKADSISDVLEGLEVDLKAKTDENSLDSLKKHGIIAKFDGAEKRLIALYQLSGFHLIITMLFIVIEMLPLIVKLMSNRGSYDIVLDRMEKECQLQQDKILVDKKNEIIRLSKEADDLVKIQSETRIKVQQSYLDGEIQANKSVMEDIAEKQGNLARAAVKKWYTDELARLKNDKSYNYIGSKAAPKSNLEQSFWRQKNSGNKTEWFFRTDAGNQFMQIQNGLLTTGKWSYAGTPNEIFIEFSNGSTTYAIVELDEKQLILKEKSQGTMLAFERIS